MAKIRKRVYLPRDSEKEEKYSPRDSLVKLAKDMNEFGLLNDIKRIRPIADSLIINYKKQNEKAFYLAKVNGWPFKEGEIPENCAEIALIFRMNESVPELPEEFFEGLKEQGYNDLGKYIKISGCLEYVPFDVFATLIKK